MSLRYVLLKERNRCLTVDAYHRQYLQRTSSYAKQLASVQESMENLKEVIQDRVSVCVCVCVSVLT